MNSNLVCVHLKVSIIVLTVKLPGSTLWQVTTIASTRCSVYIEVKKKVVETWNSSLTVSYFKVGFICKIWPVQPYIFCQGVA